MYFIAWAKKLSGRFALIRLSHPLVFIYQILAAGTSTRRICSNSSRRCTATSISDIVASSFTVLVIDCKGSKHNILYTVNVGAGALIFCFLFRLTATSTSPLSYWAHDIYLKVYCISVIQFFILQINIKPKTISCLLVLALYDNLLL